MNAVENGRVYTIDADIASRAGPRIVNATEIVYECLSESFGDTETPTPEPAGFEAVLVVASLLAVLCFLRRRTRRNKI